MGGVSRTASLVLAADPRTHGDGSAIEAKVALAETAVQDIDALQRAVNDIRAQSEARRGRCRTRPADRTAVEFHAIGTP